MNLSDAVARQQSVAEQRAVLRAEQYVRICALLVKAIETQTDDALVRVDGKVAVRAEAFRTVPERYAVSLRPAKVRAGDDPNAPEEDVIVVDVTPKQKAPVLAVPKANGANGASRIVVP